MSLPLFAVMSPSGVRRWMISVEVAASINTTMMRITLPTLERERRAGVGREISVDCRIDPQDGFGVYRASIFRGR